MRKYGGKIASISISGKTWRYVKRGGESGIHSRRTLHINFLQHVPSCDRAKVMFEEDDRYSIYPLLFFGMGAEVLALYILSEEALYPFIPL